jgi:RNA polymerase sigma-70 factor, ECF subfamily
MDTADRAEHFVRLLSIHQRRVYSCIVALVPQRADAEDVFQETAAVLWRKFDQYDPAQHFGAWACRIAYFEVLAFRRKNRERSLSWRDSFLEFVSSDVVARSGELDQRQEALAWCLEKLRPADRELIALRYGGGATTRTVAETTGRPVGGMYKVFQRIHRTLFECVDRTLAREAQE